MHSASAAAAATEESNLCPNFGMFVFVQTLYLKVNTFSWSPDAVVSSKVLSVSASVNTRDVSGSVAVETWRSDGKQMFRSINFTDSLPPLLSKLKPAGLLVALQIPLDNMLVALLLVNLDNLKHP
jgi:hypothetical protein